MKSTIQALIQELEAPALSRKLGTGWLSGVFALLCGLLSLAGVIILHYPELFTVPEIRNGANVVWVRTLMMLVIVAGFVLACISMILRQNKVLGLSASFMVLLALLMGGAATQKSADFSGNVYFGLDWFVLNLLLTGILFLPLERMFRRVSQSVFRFEWREDLLYFLISSIFVQSLTYLSMLPAMTILSFGGLTSLQGWIVAQPVWLQFIEIMFLTDLVQYWVHRLFHQIPFLWRFHAVHHSAQAMDWLAGSRMHVMEIILLRGVTIIPMYVLGFSETAIYAYILVVYLYATYVHANLKFDIEWLKPVLVTPRFHHWHHGIEKEAVDVNFAVHFPIFDRLFGTYYMPVKKWPCGYGVGGHPVPSGYLKQFLYPFTRK